MSQPWPGPEANPATESPADPTYVPLNPAHYAPRVAQVLPSAGVGPQRDRRAAARRVLTRLAGVSATRDCREYVELQRRLTTAVTSGRRIVVLATEPGQGATTVAALLATALATRRADPVLLADAAAIGPAPLHRVLQVDPVRTIRELAADPREITSRAGFDGQLTPVGREVWLLPGDELVGRSGLHAPDARTYTAAVTPFGRYFDITVADLGASPGDGTTEALLDRAHALCLVTSPARFGFETVITRLRQLRDAMATPWAGRTVVVTNHPRPPVAVRRTGRAARHRPTGIPVVHLAHDPALAPGFPRRLAQLRPETHLAAMRLAAEVIDTAVPAGAADPRHGRRR